MEGPFHPETIVSRDFASRLISSTLKSFEVDLAYLRSHLDDMAESVFSDLQSQFLVLPRGKNLVTYGDFQTAYEVLKRHTAAFATVSEAAIWQALRENALSLMVLRTILGISPPE
jgi:hypothetical protein